VLLGRLVELGDRDASPGAHGGGLRIHLDVLHGGQVIDGTGNPWFYADIAITGNRIENIGNLQGYTAGEIIDAAGLYVAPGFIDVHSHAGPGLASEELSHGQPLLAQGITTVIINPDGGGALDMAEQREQLQEHGLGVDVAQLIPHGTVRREVLGDENRPPAETELGEMKRLVETGMEEGAFGLSSGLFYTPGAFAKALRASSSLRVPLNVMLIASQCARSTGTRTQVAVMRGDESFQILCVSRTIFISSSL
jgi:N-acyl-D-aspartate/D-glutamate deacylase